MSIIALSVSSDYPTSDTETTGYSSPDLSLNGDMPCVKSHFTSSLRKKIEDSRKSSPILNKKITPDIHEKIEKTCKIVENLKIFLSSLPKNSKRKESPLTALV